MSDKGAEAVTPGEGEEEDISYNPPAQKSLNEIIAADEEDESLRRYKAALLGDVASSGDSGSVIIFPDDPRQVIVKKLALIVEGRSDKELDLTTNLEEIKKNKFHLKEGIQYRIRIEFYVQREIVSGLKYVQKTSRMGVTVDKMSHMVGSYPPKDTAYSYLSPPEDAPSGLTGRGTYHVHSLFVDDDKKEHLKWEWYIEVRKDWGED